MNTKRKNKSRTAQTNRRAKLITNGKSNQGKVSRKKVSSLDPFSLINKPRSLSVKQDVFVPAKGFEEMPIHMNLKANLHHKGYTHPTQIQEETLEHLIKGSDLIGIANTGTGKTGAFLIPVIHQLLTRKKPFKTLVVVPTRELALQVEQEFETFADGLPYRAACFIGGTSINKDIAKLRKRNDLIIGTPGRLLDLSNRGVFKLHEMSTLILDEFDRMLDMGFKHDIMKMLELMPNRKQTMLFSATIDKSQTDLINQIVHHPIEVRVNSGLSTSDQIEQDIIRVPVGSDKFSMMLDLVNQSDFEKVLVFTETKRQADKVSKRLNASGVPSNQIHGNKSQNYRNNALNQFKSGSIKVLVATDVAARGIDVPNVSHVINYQIPMSFDSYTHRIGRTGRAGKPGKSFTFVD